MLKTPHMSMHSRLTHDPARARSPLVAEGRGVVLAVGHKPVNVTYKLRLETILGNIRGSGTLLARPSALENMWLEPIVILRMSDGQNIDISITDFDGEAASFEISGADL